MTWEGLTPPYATIVADPPWCYETRVSGGTRTSGAWKERPWNRPDSDYSLMTVEEIRSLPVAELAASNSWCFVWTTNRYLRESFDVLAEWGFRYRQTMVWYKTGDPSPFGPALAANHAEFLLAGTRGSPEVVSRWPGSVIAHNRSRRHSEKPALFTDLIESATKGPYVELFARAPRLGWDHWGHGYEVAS